MGIFNTIWERGLTPKDYAGNFANIAALTVVATGAATQVNADYTIPIDRVLLISSIVCQGAGGGAQVLARQRIELLDESSIALVTIRGQITTNAIDFLNFSEEVIIPAGYGIRAVNIFSAGVAVNTATLSVNGWLVPIGGLRK
jgi:hypothetical protein